MARPGFVLEVDERTPPLLVHQGEGFRLQKFPLGSRVIYPPDSLPKLRGLRNHIRHALDHPHGSEPLRELLTPGMKLTIAIDDISIPLPPMQSPDIRQLVLEEVIELAARRGVEDVKLYMANSLHRRMTADEIKHAVGERVFRSFYPKDLKNHDAEDPENLAYVGKTDQGEEVEINKRAMESDLLIYVNINLVAMDGGHKSVPVGLASYRSVKHHHNVHTMLHSKSYMDPRPGRSAIHDSCRRMGDVLKANGLKVFTIETTMNNNTFPDPFGFMNKREWEWSLVEQGTYLAAKKANDMGPSAMKHQIWTRIKSPAGVTGIVAGDTDAVHEQTLATLHRQQLVEVDGQSDIMVVGLPYICPYNVNSIMNPILVHCLGLGVPVQPLPEQAGRPARRRDDHVPPRAERVPPGAPPVLRGLLRGGPHRDHRSFNDRVQVRGALRDRSLVHPPVPEELRVSRRASVLHVVLGSARARLPGRRDRGGRGPEDVRAARLPRGVELPGRPGDGGRDRRALTLDLVLPRATARDRGREVAAMARKRFTSEIRDVAKGWRWGRRTMTPRSALDSTPPPKIWSYPTDWARTGAGRLARDVILDAALKPIIWNETTPEVFGLDNLEGVKGP